MLNVLLFIWDIFCCLNFFFTLYFPTMKIRSLSHSISTWCWKQTIDKKKIRLQILCLFFSKVLLEKELHSSTTKKKDKINRRHVSLTVPVKDWFPKMTGSQEKDDKQQHSRNEEKGDAETMLIQLQRWRESREMTQRVEDSSRAGKNKAILHPQQMFWTIRKVKGLMLVKLFVHRTSAIKNVLDNATGITKNSPVTMLTKETGCI